MERTYAYEKLIAILLALSKLAVTETTEFYCTRASNWREAMSTCLRLGGKSMSYQDIADTPDVKLKRGTSVWTADYGYWEIVESVPQLTKDYECGYMRFTQEYSGTIVYWYSSSTGVEYDDCSNTRSYFCENEPSDYPDTYGRDTWFQAYQSCKSPNSLWSGHEFRYPYLENPQLWVKSARKFIRDTLKDTIPTKEQLVQCGTSEAPINREEGNNCEQLFQAVCILETRTDDARLSHSCLQDTPTTAPATTVSTRKTTLKPTRPTTQLITTTKPSQESTKSIYSTSSLYTPTTAPATTVSTWKTTLKPTRPTTQITTTTKPSQLSTKTIYSTSSLSTPETPTPTPATSASTGKTTLEATKPTTQLTTTMEPTRQSTEIFNDTTFKSTPGGLPKTKIIIIATGTTAVIICCIVIVILSLCFGRKRRKSNKKHSRMVKFQTHNPSTKSLTPHCNNDPDDTEGACNEADTTGYYEVHLDFKDDNNTTEVYGKEKQTYDYEYAFSVSENPKPSNNTTRNIIMSESQYDSTKNVKVFNESSNIYNKLGCETFEGVYDSTMSKPNRKPVFERNIYSKISRGENLYDKTATAVLEYDTTNNVKVINESSNIYNKLEYESHEGVYDSTMSKPNRKPVFEANIYSKISRGENLYDKTATAGVGTARLNDAFISPDGNVYGYPDRHVNVDSRMHGNLVSGQQSLGPYDDYGIENDYF